MKNTRTFRKEQILNCLKTGSKTVKEIAEEIGASESSTRKFLWLLEKEGRVKKERRLIEGQRRVYFFSLAEDPIDDLEGYLWETRKRELRVERELLKDIIG